MPKPPDVTDSRTFDPTDSLYKTPPQPKPPEPPKPEVKIPEFKKEKPPKQIEHRSKRLRQPATPAPGQRRCAKWRLTANKNVPTMFRPDFEGAAAPGVNIQGQGGGDFAARYGWYIDAVRRRISQNWMQSTIDPAVRSNAHTVVMPVDTCCSLFVIARDGTVRDLRVAQTSGNQLHGHFRPARPPEFFADAPALPNGRYSGSCDQHDFRFRSGNDAMNNDAMKLAMPGRAARVRGDRR